MKELPAAVHLLTLELVDDTTVLLRLEHQFETGEGMDSAVTVSLQVSYKLVVTLSLCCVCRICSHQ